MSEVQPTITGRPGRDQGADTGRGVAIITTRSWRKHGELVDLPSSAIGAGVAGFSPLERCVALVAAARDDHLVARPSFVNSSKFGTPASMACPCTLTATKTSSS